MSIAQGVSKFIAIKKQAGLGTPASGAGGQLLRRETAMGKLTVATYENNEIDSAQQSKGKTHGGRSASFTLNGLLSGNTYSTLFASLLRGTFAATTPVTASITIAGAGPTYTLTDAANGFLVAGIKIGDVIRITAGTYTNPVNKNNNLLVTAVTATVITVVTVNGTTLIAEGPIAASTITIVGKKCYAPATGQTREYWTVEEWHSDISRSATYTDAMVGSIDVGIPSSGNSTVALNMAALNRTLGASQVLTSPTAETTTSVVQGINGKLILNGSVIANVTGATLKIDNGAAGMGAVLGSNVSPDIQRGITKVSGQLTAFFQDGTLSTYFDAATPLSLVIVDAVDGTNTSEFITFSMSKVVLDADDHDDGLKGIVLTIPFTAQINGAGGAALANDLTILTTQDSLA